MKKLLCFIAFAVLTVFVANGQQQSPQLPFRDTNLSTDKRVADLLGRMTLEEKVEQVYLRNPNDPTGPIKSLKGFKRVSLKAGQSQKVSFDLAPETFNSFNDQTQKFEVLPGKYELLYGSSSADKSLKKVAFEIQ